MLKCNIFILPIEARLFEFDKDTDSVNESGPRFGCTSPDNNNSKRKNRRLHIIKLLISFLIISMSFALF